LLIAHRGGETLAGGDVLEGARRLVELGIEMAEIDVRRTRDGVLVIHHDEDLRGEKICARRYEELAKDGSALPTLAEFLEIAAGRLAVDLELKEPGYEAEALGEALDRLEADQVVMTSFDDSAVAAVKRLAPRVPAGLVVGRRTPGKLLRDAFPFDRLRACGADFLAPHHALLLTGLGHRAERLGVRLLLWNVRSPGQIERYLRDPRVLGVVTDAIETE
jgi:glycerophosphoryl diester phosphodiesterase